MNQPQLQLGLLADEKPPPANTEGIKYIGSKMLIIPYIIDVARRINARTILDGFSGTTRVSQAFAQNGHDVISSDISAWSEVFATCYLRKCRINHLAELIQYLNNVEPFDGWFTEHYGGDASESEFVNTKKPWQRHNTRKLDAIRDAIDEMSLSKVENAVLLTSLILALDRVDSTLGHFASYLKQWSPRSYKNLELKEPMFVETAGSHEVRPGDIFQVLDDLPEVDLAYFDPPYGSNNEKMPPSRVRYAAYYHIWTTVCLNDRPKLFGKAKRRVDTRDKVAASVFEDFRRNFSGRFRSVVAIERLISSVRARYILLSYSSGGRATSAELIDVLQKCGEIIEIREIEYKRNVMSGMRWTNKWVRPREGKNFEYLFLLRKH